jgi:hypothetical protein
MPGFRAKILLFQHHPQRRAFKINLPAALAQRSKLNGALNRSQTSDIIGDKRSNPD